MPFIDYTADTHYLFAMNNRTNFQTVELSTPLTFIAMEDKLASICAQVDSKRLVTVTVRGLFR